MDSDLMSPRKRMAGAAGDSDFGVGKIGKPVAHPDRKMDTSKSMADADRATAPSMDRGAGKMAAERNSDHGPHNVPGKR